MGVILKGFLGSRDQFEDLSTWAAALEFAVQEGLRYERWWEARLPLQEIHRQYVEEQIEKGRRALEGLAKVPGNSRRNAD